MDIVTQSSLSDVLHAFAQALLAPDIILLFALVAYALFSIGSVAVEYFTERRNFKVSMPQFLSALMGAEEKDIPAVITESGLLNRQKSALLTVYDYRTLPGDALLALIRREVNKEETRYDKITGRNNTAAKVSPMLGLMGTLIPLGPGIEALGRTDTSALSSSLLIAFDTTVTGLVVAAICLAIGKLRSTWYNDYLSAMDSAMATMLQKIETLRSEGKISIKEPSDYAFLFEEGLKSASQKSAQEKGVDAGSVPAAGDTTSARTGMSVARETEAPAGTSAARETETPAGTPSPLSASRAESRVPIGTSSFAPASTTTSGRTDSVAPASYAASRAATPAPRPSVPSTPASTSIHTQVQTQAQAQAQAQARAQTAQAQAQAQPGGATPQIRREGLNPAEGETGAPKEGASRG
ncbi:MAG: MotA/TolQ/ExbB proton channel family protein [Eggerthellaceae bacterium]|nr:MotA/TolQ/ExbB proton channel family protein [Eggerthellaceae bacterium]